MRKSQLQKIWKQLDGACEAIERLEEEGIVGKNIDLTAIVNLKNIVELMIEEKTRIKN